MIDSRAENEAISCAADVFGYFGAVNGGFLCAGLCYGAFRADMAAYLCTEGIVLALPELQESDNDADQLIWE